MFTGAFFDAAGPENAEAFYGVGVRAGGAWAPLGDPVRDAALRGWVERERVLRATSERVVKPIPAWERRSRRDRLPPVPLETLGLLHPEPWREPEMPTFAVADAADQEADAVLERTARVLAEWRQRRKGEQ